jgi:peptidoglycan/xylan/chitin deacetylase (PgdA/CDA1 family)
MSDRLLVMGWHNVAGTFGFPAGEGEAERGFASQMKTLARIGNVLPLDEALGRLAAGEPLPGRAVAITFDDGYRDNLTLAVPVLERLGLPATFFLVPELLSGKIDAWWETIGWALSASSSGTLSWEGMTFRFDASDWQTAYSPVVRRLKRRSRAARDEAMAELLEMLSPEGDPPDLFMNWDGARELARRGFSVQSHTRSHVVLSEETPEEQLRELVEGRAQLESELGTSVSTIAYPQGGPLDYNAATLTATTAAGYTWGLTTHEGFTTSATSPLEIRRCVIYPERGIVDLAAQLRYMVTARIRRFRQ